MNLAHHDAAHVQPAPAPETLPAHPREPVAKLWLAEAARHLRGVPITVDRYTDLLDRVREDALDEQAGVSERGALREVRRLEDQYVTTSYVIKNRASLEPERRDYDYHEKGFQMKVAEVPRSLLEADPRLETFYQALSRPFSRGLKDLTYARACLLGKDTARAASYIKSALKSHREAAGIKDKIEDRLQGIGDVRPDLIPSIDIAMKHTQALGVHIGHLHNTGLDLLDGITDTERKDAAN